MDGPRVARENWTLWRCGRVRSCVRPVGAVGTTAGPDEVCETGPDQNCALSALDDKRVFPFPGATGWPSRHLRPCNGRASDDAATKRNSVSSCSPTPIRTRFPAAQPAPATARGRNGSPRASTAQAIRAILLASAVITTRGGRRASRRSTDLRRRRRSKASCSKSCHSKDSV